MGIKVKKQWLSTPDGRTRHSHAMLDGQSVNNDKPFANGCMFPGDPKGPPAEVYNCRCTLIADIEDVDTSDALRRGKEGLPPNMTYSQWEKTKRGEGYLQTDLTQTEKVRVLQDLYNSIKESGLQRLPNIDTFTKMCYASSPEYRNLIARYENLTGKREWSAIEFNPATLREYFDRKKKNTGKDRWRSMERNKRCACCGRFSLPFKSAYEICPVCGWQDDDIQNESPDLDGGANAMSLLEAKEAYKKGKKIE